MEKQPFEKSWQDAFQGKEKQPAPQIWNSISGQLASAAANRNRKRAVFFQWLAAASILLALTIVFWNQRPSAEPRLLAEDQIQNQLTPATPAPVQPAAKTPFGAAPARSAGASGSRNREAKKQAEPRVAGFRPAGGIRQKVDFQERALAFLSESRANSDLITSNEPAGSNETKVDSQEMPFGVTPSPTRAKEASEEVFVLINESTLATAVAESSAEKDTPGSRPLWTSVSFAGGGFNTALASGNRLDAATTADFAMANGLRGTARASSQKEQVGTAFSFGVGVGKMVARRWSLQTGFVYLQQSVRYTSNLVSLGASNSSARVFLPESLSASTYSADLAITAPYQLQASLNYLSFPMLAGYVILDRTFSIQVNGGVATDFLVQSAWQDRSGQFNDNRQSANEVYRPVNWAALFNTEFSYRIGKRYRASLVPGLRQSVQPLYRPEIGNELRPLIWDLGFRLRYQF